MDGYPDIDLSTGICFGFSDSNIQVLYIHGKLQATYLTPTIQRPDCTLFGFSLNFSITLAYLSTLPYKYDIPTIGQQSLRGLVQPKVQFFLTFSQKAYPVTQLT